MQLVLVAAVSVVQCVHVVPVLHVKGVQLVARELGLPDEGGGVVQLGEHGVSPLPGLFQLLSGDDDVGVLNVCLDQLGVAAQGS